MKIIMKFVRNIARAMHAISGTILIAMMLVIMADVISRAVFGMTEGSIDLTFLGGVEMIKYGLLFTILFSLPYSVSRSQVIVDLFTENMSEKLKAILAAIYTFGFGLLGLGMSLRFFESMVRVAETGETTQDLLIPMSYIYSLTAAATAVLAARGFLVSIYQFNESRKMS